MYRIQLAAIEYGLRGIDSAGCSELLRASAISPSPAIRPGNKKTSLNQARVLKRLGYWNSRLLIVPTWKSHVLVVGNSGVCCYWSVWSLAVTPGEVLQQGLQVGMRREAGELLYNRSRPGQIVLADGL